MEGSAWLSWPVLRTWLWYFSVHFLKHNFRHQDLILLSWLPISFNKHVNSGTTVLLFLGRPKEPRTCRLAFQVHVISRLRSYNRAGLDIATVSTALNRIDQILPLWVRRWTVSCEYIEWQCTLEPYKAIYPHNTEFPTPRIGDTASPLQNLVYTVYNSL
jgi:hypothetical protein